MSWCCFRSSRSELGAFNSRWICPQSLLDFATASVALVIFTQGSPFPLLKSVCSLVSAVTFASSGVYPVTISDKPFANGSDVVQVGLFVDQAVRLARDRCRARTWRCIRTALTPRNTLPSTNVSVIQHFRQAGLIGLGRFQRQHDRHAGADQHERVERADGFLQDARRAARARFRRPRTAARCTCRSARRRT